MLFGLIETFVGKLAEKLFLDQAARAITDARQQRRCRGARCER